MISITNISKQMMRSCLLLLVLLTQALTSSAQVELSLEDFTIASSETKELSLILSNDQPATALQVTIDLPNGLKYVKDSAKKTDRVKGRGAVVQSSEKTGKLVIVETDGTIAAGTGAVITFKVEAGDDLTEGNYGVELTDIIISSAEGTQLNQEESYTATAKFLGLDCKFSAAESLEVSVEQEYQVDVTMTNKQDITAFQGTLTLPEGLEIVVPDEEEPGELFIYSDRIPKTNNFKFQQNEGVINFVLSSTMNSKLVGNDGVVFSFKVKATDALAEESKITLTNIYAATTNGKSQLCDPVTISVTNTSVADKAAFDEYKAEQTAAVEALAEEGDSEEAQAIIAAAVEAINALNFDYALTLDENKAAVDELVAPVAEALQAQRAAEQLAADKAAFDEFKAEQIAAVEALAAEGDSEASQQIIAEAVAAIEALEYDEEKTLDENKAAVDEVVAPVAEALEAQRAAEALAADKAAFDEFKAEQIAAVEALAAEGDSEASQQIIAEAVAAIEALEYDEAKTLEENKAAVAEVVAPVEEALEAQRTADAAAAAEQLAADKAAFDTYKAEQTAAVEALAEEGDSEASQQIIANAVAAIEALEYDEEKTLDENKAAVDAAVAPVAEALAEQRAADEAAAKAAANEAAYTTLKAQYDELRAALRQAKNTIKSDYADVAAQFDDAIADIEDMLSDAIAKLEGEYAAGKLTAESQLQNGETIAAGIEKLLADVAAAQLAADKAAFDTYKSEQTAAVEALAEEGDSEASQQIIAEAVAAIEALEYDEALTLDENKAAVDAVVAPVADALAEQRAADAIIPGDTNGDGEVNTVDASYILMYLVGNVPADFVEAAADVDGNGRIDTLDATAILKKLVE